MPLDYDAVKVFVKVARDHLFNRYASFSKGQVFPCVDSLQNLKAPIQLSLKK